MMKIFSHAAYVGGNDMNSGLQILRGSQRMNFLPIFKRITISST